MSTAEGICFHCKMNKYFRLFILFLFTVNLAFFIFRSGNERMSGDEAASYISVAPFLHGLFMGKIVPTFLVFFHEPMFQIISAFMILFGAAEWLVRLPNTISGVILFVVLYKVGRLLFGKSKFYIASLLILYVFNEFTLFYLRPGINVGLFNLILTLSLYYLIKFEKNRSLSDFNNVYKLSLLNFFVYIDAIFTFPGVLISFVKSKAGWRKKIFDKGIIISSITAFVFLASWSIGVYLASVISHQFKWYTQAPFSLIRRGGSYSLSAISDNIQLFSHNNSPELTAITFVFLFLSIFDKRSRIVWGLLAIPLIYFNLVKMPTIHLTFFWAPILIASTLGLRFVVERIPITKYFILVFFAFSIMRNIHGISWTNPFTYDRHYKVSATLVRHLSKPCEKIYTNDRWNVFQLYYNRGFVTEMNEGINLAVIVNKVEGYDLTGFGQYAELSEPGRTAIHIFKRGYTGEVVKPHEIDESLFSFSNTLTYFNSCLL